jgi:hypothetical protein
MASITSGIPPEEFIEAAKEFLSIIDAGSELEPVQLAQLEGSLDRLAYLQHCVAPSPESVDVMPAPRRDYRALRAAVAARFPRLGSYRLPTPVIRVGHGEIPVADAIDDITEIASELHEVLWQSEHAGLNAAVWHFHHGYRWHWSGHVRGLQFHLHSLMVRP